MSLPTSMLTNPLDAGYERTRLSTDPPNRFVGRLGVFVVAVALGFRSVVATKSPCAVGDVKADLKHQAAQRLRSGRALDDGQSLRLRSTDLSLGRHTDHAKPAAGSGA